MCDLPVLHVRPTLLVDVGLHILRPPTFLVVPDILLLTPVLLAAGVHHFTQNLDILVVRVLALLEFALLLVLPLLLHTLRPAVSLVGLPLLIEVLAHLPRVLVLLNQTGTGALLVGFALLVGVLVSFLRHIHNSS